MSDTESQTTLEDVSFSKILEILEAAAEESIANKDYLSYSTVLDIYLGQPSRYSYPEREEILAKLLSILEENHVLTYEIGWDLPHLIVPYVDLDYDFAGLIRQSPCVYKIMKLFETLALHGNPKELLLKGCELLSTLKISDLETVTSDEYLQEKFFNIKLYCIIELLTPCMLNIKSYYPSRFLSMIFTAFINMLHQNPPPTTTLANFQIKRAYSLARNYSPPLPTPELVKEALAQGLDLDKISAEENAIIRKLLTSFVTCTVEIVFKDHIEGYSLDLVSYFQESKRDKLQKYFDFRVTNESMDRIFLLGQSFDIDAEERFVNFVKESHKLFKLVDYTKDDEDSHSSKIFETVLVDYQKNVYTSLINAEKEITDSQYGSLLIYTHFITKYHNLKEIEFTFEDAVALTLRVTIPGMIQLTFKNRGVHDVLVFWCWVAINALSAGELEEEIATKIPPVLLKLFIQSLLFIVISSPTNGNFRYLIMSLLTRVLSLSPENITYDFLTDSLENCPYDNVRVALGGVLRELMTKDRETIGGNDLAEKLSSVKLLTEEKVVDEKKEGKESSDAKVAPPLPSRKYITLTKTRADQILEITSQTHSETFKFNPTSANVDISKLSTLSACLNLLVVIKSNTSVDQEKLTSIVESVLGSIEKVKTLEKDDADKVNAVDILSIAIERIKSK